MNDDERLRELIRRLKDLQIEESELLREVEQINERRRENVRAHHTGGEPSRPFRVGDRIYVVNRVRRPTIIPRGSDWTAGKERQGTVTGIDRRSNRIYYTSDNGTETWRLSKNLTHLNQN